MPKVLISDALSAAAVQIFKDRGVEVDFQPALGKDKDKLAEIIGNYNGLAIRSATKVTPKILANAKNLKVIGRAGIGVDNVDIPAATAKGIIVMNTPFGNSITTAEHAITLMLALARQIPQADASTQAGKWEKNKFMGVEITGKTLGVIGCGNIGSIAADRALGLKMKVVAFDPYLSPERAFDLGVEKVELDELLIERIPIAVAHARRFLARILIGVGIDQAADEAELFDAALKLGQHDVDRLARELRQHQHAGEAFGIELHRAVDDVVAFLMEPLDDLARTLAVHHLERARRQQLQIRADALEHAEVPAGGHFLLVGVMQDLFVRYLRHAPAVLTPV